MSFWGALLSFLNRRNYCLKLPYGRYCDPLFAYRVLLGGNCDTLLDKRESENPDIWIQAELELCKLIRQAFQLPDFDPTTGDGWTDEMCLETLQFFLDYLEGKGWAGRQTSPMSAPPTADPAER